MLHSDSNSGSNGMNNLNNAMSAGHGILAGAAAGIAAIPAHTNI